MAKMRAVQVARAGGPLELIEKEMPEPARGEVRVHVEACGVCHSDIIPFRCRGSACPTGAK